MPNIIDYVLWRGDLSIGQSALNDVDCLCLSILSYIDFRRVVPPTPASGYDDAVITLRQAARNLYCLGRNPCRGVLMPECNGRLLGLMAKSRRFGNMRLSGYSAKRDERLCGQFGAVMVHMGDGMCFVSFCGTDDSIVGWKEDFDLVCKKSIPSQQNALKYLSTVASQCREMLVVGGHSKGGNLSLYAALGLGSEYAKKIFAVYDFDGPYRYEALPRYAKYTSGCNCGDCGIAGKYRIYAPECSFAGVILGKPCECVVVKSNDAGVWQHNPYTWQVRGSEFMKTGGFTWESRALAQAFKVWMQKTDIFARRRMVDLLYKMVRKNGAKTLTDLLCKHSEYNI